MVIPEGSPLDPSKLFLLSIFESLWVCEAIGSILSCIVSNSHFGKRPAAGDMSICSRNFHGHVTNNVMPYCWNFRISGPRPSPGLTFGLWLHPYDWETRILVHLRRGSFLWKIDFTNISVMFQSSPVWPGGTPGDRILQLRNYLPRINNVKKIDA